VLVSQPEISGDTEPEPQDDRRSDDPPEPSPPRPDAVRRAVRQYLATTAV
jgi:hypothetical protein